MAPSIIKSKARNACGSFFRNDFQAFHDAGDDFVLKAGVQILGVFADDRQIHAFKVGFHAGDVFHRPQIGVKIQRLAKRHVDAGRASGNSCCHGAFQGHAVAAHGTDGFLIYALVVVGRAGGSPGDFLPFDLHACGFQNAARGTGHFRADAFAGNERNLMLHGCISL